MVNCEELRAWGKALVAEGVIPEYGSLILVLCDELDMLNKTKPNFIEVLRQAAIRLLGSQITSEEHAAALREIGNLRWIADVSLIPTSKKS